MGVLVNPSHTHPLHPAVLAALLSQERGRGWSLVDALMEEGRQEQDVTEIARGIKVSRRKGSSAALALTLYLWPLPLPATPGFPRGLT